MKFKVTRTFEIEGFGNCCGSKCAYKAQWTNRCLIFNKPLKCKQFETNVLRCDECMQAEKKYLEKGNETQTLD